MSAQPIAAPWDYFAQPRKAVEACNLCGNKTFVVLATQDRYGFPQETHGCETCGLIFLNPLMSREAYAEFYARGIYRDLVYAQYKGAGGKGTKEEVERELPRSQMVYAQLLCQFLAPFIRRDGTLLDIGGASGIVAGMLAGRFGLQPSILEPSGEMERPEIIKGTLEDWSDPRTFDLVTMCQTVDHLHDLTGGLRKVRQALAGGGLFYVDILDLRMEVRRRKGLGQSVKLDHPYYLTEETAELALSQCGFRVLRKTYCVAPCHVGYLCDTTDAPNVPWPDARAIFREVRG